MADTPRKASPRKPLERTQTLQRWLGRTMALLFFASLVALSSLVVRDIEGLSRPLGIADRVAPGQLEAERAETETLKEASRTAREQFDDSRTRLRDARSALASQESEYHNWLSLRRATEAQETNPEVRAKLDELTTLRNATRELEQRTVAQREVLTASERRVAELGRRLSARDREIHEQLEQENPSRALKAFLIRLALVLPLLVLGIWLLVRHRNARLGSLVWGFGLFSIYLFLFGLVPYLPSFGGYIRFVGAIVLVILGAIYSERWFRRYLEQRRAEIAKAAEVRSRSIGIEEAVAAYRSRTCPSCAQDFSLSGDKPHHCLECGIRLFAPCPCGTLNFAYFNHCSNCGRGLRTPDGSEAGHDGQ